MKKRLLLVGIFLSLVLALVVPGTAVAARPHRLLQPFDAWGTFLDIDEGDVMGGGTRDFLSRTKANYIVKPFGADQLRKEVNEILAACVM